MDVFLILQLQYMDFRYGIYSQPRKIGSMGLSLSIYIYTCI